MHKFIAAALIAAVTVPVVAPTSAIAATQSYRDDRRDDRRDRVEDRRRDDRRDRIEDRRRDDRRDRWEDRRRDDRRDQIRDRDRRWGQNDWQHWRERNRGTFARGQWRAPFRYNSFRAGTRIAPSYYGSRYMINDPWRYRLPPTGYNQRWVRHYDDMLLVDTRRGTVIRVIRSFYR